MLWKKHILSSDILSQLKHNRLVPPLVKLTYPGFSANWSSINKLLALINLQQQVITQLKQKLQLQAASFPFRTTKRSCCSPFLLIILLLQLALHKCLQLLYLLTSITMLSFKRYLSKRFCRNYFHLLKNALFLNLLEEICSVCTQAWEIRHAALDASINFLHCNCARYNYWFDILFDLSKIYMINHVSLTHLWPRWVHLRERRHMV